MLVIMQRLSAVMKRDEIQTIISGLRESLGQTFVIVTHDPQMAEIANRTVHMEDGKIIYL